MPRAIALHRWFGRVLLLLAEVLVQRFQDAFVDTHGDPKRDLPRSTRIQLDVPHEVVPLDALSAEERYAIEPKDVSTADNLFERRWALTLLERVLTRLQSETALERREK